MNSSTNLDKDDLFLDWANDEFSSPECSPVHHATTKITRPMSAIPQPIRPMPSFPSNNITATGGGGGSAYVSQARLILLDPTNTPGGRIGHQVKSPTPTFDEDISSVCPGEPDSLMSDYRAIHEDFQPDSLLIDLGSENSQDDARMQQYLRENLISPVHSDSSDAVSAVVDLPEDPIETPRGDPAATASIPSASVLSALVELQLRAPSPIEAEPLSQQEGLSTILEERSYEISENWRVGVWSGLNNGGIVADGVGGGSGGNENILRDTLEGTHGGDNNSVSGSLIDLDLDDDDDEHLQMDLRPMELDNSHVEKDPLTDFLSLSREFLDNQECVNRSNSVGGSLGVEDSFSGLLDSQPGVSIDDLTLGREEDVNLQYLTFGNNNVDKTEEVDKEEVKKDEKQEESPDEEENSANNTLNDEDNDYQNDIDEEEEVKVEKEEEKKEEKNEKVIEKEEEKKKDLFHLEPDSHSKPQFLNHSFGGTSTDFQYGGGEAGVGGIASSTPKFKSFSSSVNSSGGTTNTSTTTASSSSVAAAVVSQASVELCSCCGKRVYPMERIAINNKIYHKQCFRCGKCKGALSLKNHADYQGELLCKAHFIERFKIAGRYDTKVEPTNEPVSSGPVDTSTTTTTKTVTVAASPTPPLVKENSVKNVVNIFKTEVTVALPGSVGGVGGSMKEVPSSEGALVKGRVVAVEEERQRATVKALDRLKVGRKDSFPKSGTVKSTLSMWRARDSAATTTTTTATPATQSFAKPIEIIPGRKISTSQIPSATQSQPRNSIASNCSSSQLNNNGGDDGGGGGGGGAGNNLSFLRRHSVDSNLDNNLDPYPPPCNTRNLIAKFASLYNCGPDATMTQSADGNGISVGRLPHKVGTIKFVKQRTEKSMGNATTNNNAIVINLDENERPPAGLTKQRAALFETSA